MKCNYRRCLKELPLGINGNRRYCDDDCNNSERLERERDKYEARKTILTELKRVESLLRGCFNQYGSSLFDASVLRDLKMNWTIITNTIKVDGIEYRVVGPYAYGIYQDGNVKIFKTK